MVDRKGICGTAQTSFSICFLYLSSPLKRHWGCFTTFRIQCIHTEVGVGWQEGPPMARTASPSSGTRASLDWNPEETVALAGKHPPLLWHRWGQSQGSCLLPQQVGLQSGTQWVPVLTSGLLSLGQVLSLSWFSLRLVECFLSTLSFEK